MIKRDLIQRIRVIPTDDTQGGNPIKIEPYEFVKAHCSITATGNQITQYGVTTQKLINVITNSPVSLAIIEIVPVSKS